MPQILVHGAEDVVPHLPERRWTHHEEVANRIATGSTTLVDIEPVSIFFHIANLLHSKGAAIAGMGWRDDSIRIGVDGRFPLIVLHDTSHGSSSISRARCKGQALQHRYIVLEVIPRLRTRQVGRYTNWSVHSMTKSNAYRYCSPAIKDHNCIRLRLPTGRYTEY